MGNCRPEADIGTSRAPPLARPGGTLLLNGGDMGSGQFPGRGWLGQDHSRDIVLAKERRVSEACYDSSWERTPDKYHVGALDKFLSDWIDTYLYKKMCST